MSITDKKETKTFKKMNTEYTKGSALNKIKATTLKIPILNYIFYTFLESEKMSDDVFKNIPDI